MQTIKYEMDIPEIKPTEGLIGVFDILGYKSFIRKNGVRYAAKLILNTLARFPTVLQECMTKVLPREENIDKAIADTKCLVMSDTLVLYCPLPDADSEQTTFARWVVFLFESILLNRRMFMDGLPLRGAISVGEYYVNGNPESQIYVGKPIVDAHDKTTQLELSATVLLPIAADKWSALVKNLGPDANNLLTTEYLVPCKGGKQEKLPVLNVLYYWEAFLPPIKQSNLRDLVMKSFCMHDKDTSDSVMPKLNNTELLWCSLRIRYEDLFK